MIDKVKEYLELNISDISWREYGEGTPATSPYGVIKGEKQPNGRGIRVILHYDQGKMNDLEDKLRFVIKCLREAQITSRNGCINKLEYLDYTDVTPSSDDGTISMEALFLMPTSTF